MARPNRAAVLDKIRSIIEGHGLTTDEVCELLELDVNQLLELMPNRFLEYRDNFLVYEDEDE